MRALKVSQSIHKMTQARLGTFGLPVRQKENSVGRPRTL